MARRQRLALGGAKGRRGWNHPFYRRQVATKQEANERGIGTVVELECTSRRESSVAEARLRFEGVARFDLGWAGETEFLLIPAYTSMLLPSSEIYLSLDPYDDRATEPDDRDSSVILAQHLRVHFQMKEKK